MLTNARVKAAGLAAALAILASLSGEAVAASSRAVPRHQVDDLRRGTAILRYDGRRMSGARLAARARALGADAVRFRRLPLVAVRGTRLQLRRAARARGVTSAHMDERLALDLDASGPLSFGGESARAAAYAAGYDGRGVNVAVVDSGTDGLHLDLRERVVRNVKVLDPVRTATTASFPAYVTCPAPCTTDTSGGHGTHVSGVAVGDGTASQGLYRGVAPGAGVVGLGVGEGIAVLYALAAYDYLLVHGRELKVVAVNNSFGRPQDDGRGRYDSTHPINVATRRLTEAGMTVVFSAGNSGTGETKSSEPDPERTEPENGMSDCSTRPSPEGGREPTDGICRFNPYAAAPWVLAVANGRKDVDGPPGRQHLNLTSARGDARTQTSLDGVEVRYLPSLTAPGTNVRAARSPNGATGVTCGASAEAPSCVPARPEYEPFYLALSGTSMSAPHVTGAVAVLQSAALARLRRTLTPAEVRSVLTGTAEPMTERDAFWDFPCGQPLFIECGTQRVALGTTGLPYASWQVGAGYLNVSAALARVASLPKKPPSAKPKPKRRRGASRRRARR